jgi:hypothetical protein
VSTMVLSHTVDSRRRAVRPCTAARTASGSHLRCRVVSRVGTAPISTLRLSTGRERLARQPRPPSTTLGWSPCRRRVARTEGRADLDREMPLSAWADRLWRRATLQKREG